MNLPPHTTAFKLWVTFYWHLCEKNPVDKIIVLLYIFLAFLLQKNLWFTNSGGNIVSKCVLYDFWSKNTQKTTKIEQLMVTKNSQCLQINVLLLGKQDFYNQLSTLIWSIGLFANKQQLVWDISVRNNATALCITTWSQVTKWILFLNIEKDFQCVLPHRIVH